MINNPNPMNGYAFTNPNAAKDGMNNMNYGDKNNCIPLVQPNFINPASKQTSLYYLNYL